MSINNKALISGAVVVVVILLGLTILRGREAAERAVVHTNDQDLSVRIADNPWERRRGLSGFEAEDVKAQGMLFIFPKAEVQNFWMKDMKLNLDVVWIKDSKIVSVDTNVPAPAPGEEPARMSSNPIPVDMVLELPAGYAQQFSLTPGLPIRIDLP